MHVYERTATNNWPYIAKSSSPINKPMLIQCIMRHDSSNLEHVENTVHCL